MYAPPLANGNLSPLQQSWDNTGQRQREKGRGINNNSDGQNSSNNHGRGGNNSFNDFGKSIANHENSGLKPLSSIGNNSGSNNNYQQEQYQSSIPNIKSGNSYGNYAQPSSASGTGSNKRTNSSSRHNRSSHHSRKAKQQQSTNAAGLLPPSNSLLPLAGNSSYGQYGSGGNSNSGNSSLNASGRLPQISGASNAGSNQSGAGSPLTLPNNNMLGPPLAAIGGGKSAASPSRRPQQHLAKGGSANNVLTATQSGGSNVVASAVQAVGGTANFPMTSMELHSTAGVSSIKGLKPGNANWINQDNYFITNTMDSGTGGSISKQGSGTQSSIGSILYCVLDGHGEHGHLISRRCTEHLPEYITRTSGNGSSSYPYDYKKGFLAMQSELQANSTDYDARCSGATCVLVHVYSTGATTKLVIANAGDSRAVLGRRVTSQNGASTFQAVSLSNDHKPDQPDERKRVLAAGGRLGCRQMTVVNPQRTTGGAPTISVPVGPCRVWYQHRGDTLGLAMSRSLGDVVVHQSGVSAEPELTEHIVDVNSDLFVILASDGIWDVMDSNQAVQMVFQYIMNKAASTTKSPAINPQWNALEVSLVLTKFARSRWEKLSPMVDDITCIVVKLPHP